VDREIVPLRLPPHLIEAEQSLLGGLLLDNSAWDRIADLVTEADFYRDDHRRIFHRIRKLVEQSMPADVVTVLPGVADCAVFGVPDDEFGESLLAAIQPVEGATVGADQVQSFLRMRIADYKVPRRVAFHEQLPREDTGKIFKRKLRDPYWATVARRI